VSFLLLHGFFYRARHKVLEFVAFVRGARRG
jgi:hypothetical protein